jgi:hypothetical protein
VKGQSEKSRALALAGRWALRALFGGDEAPAGAAGVGALRRACGAQARRAGSGAARRGRAGPPRRLGGGGKLPCERA